MDFSSVRMVSFFFINFLFLLFSAIWSYVFWNRMLCSTARNGTRKFSKCSKREGMLNKLQTPFICKTVSSLQSLIPECDFSMSNSVSVDDCASKSLPRNNNNLRCSLIGCWLKIYPKTMFLHPHQSAQSTHSIANGKRISRIILCFSFVECISRFSNVVRIFGISVCRGHYLNRISQFSPVFDKSSWNWILSFP